MEGYCIHGYRGSSRLPINLVLSSGMATVLGRSTGLCMQYYWITVGSVFLINCSKVYDEDVFGVSKSEAYYFVNTKPLFDSPGLECNNERIMCNLNRGKHGYAIL